MGMILRDMVSFGEEKIDWLKNYVELKNGIPSHDTFNRTLQLIVSERFRNVLSENSLLLDIFDLWKDPTGF
jgi:hypothetical protein